MLNSIRSATKACNKNPMFEGSFCIEGSPTFAVLIILPTGAGKIKEVPVAIISIAPSKFVRCFVANLLKIVAFGFSFSSHSSLTRDMKEKWSSERVNAQRITITSPFSVIFSSCMQCFSNSCNNIDLP